MRRSLRKPDIKGVPVRLRARRRQHFASKDSMLAVPGYRVVDTALERTDPDASIDELVLALTGAIVETFGDEYLRVAGRITVERPDMADRLAMCHAEWADYLAQGNAAAAGRDQPTDLHRLDAGMTIMIVGLAAEESTRHGGEVLMPELADGVLPLLRAGLGQPREHPAE